MAPQSKKNSKTSSKKKSVTKRVPSKKPKKKKAKSTSLKRDLLIIVGLLLFFSLFLYAYFMVQDNGTKTPQVQTKKHLKTPKKVSKPVVKKKKEERLVEEHRKVTQTSLKHTKPSLVIIIDDVHTRAQLSAIQALHMKVTPSIFPPYKLSPNSHRLAQGLKHYMIHLPMESNNQQLNTQYKTLKVSFSNKKIENRIKELRLLFPTARYINNHTGSVFTSDYAAMHLAYKVMKKNGFVFVDSMTINSSKVEEIAYAAGDLYLSRDIFIDNKHTVPAIHAQLKKAVQIAKRKGYAIAIGHPHTITIQALSSAKELLKDVELLYIDELTK